MSAAIETHLLGKTYGETRAVVDLDLRVERGEVFGFLGPNGAGKTTTIRMLLGLQRPTSGRAEALGLDVLGESVELHRRVGYVPGDLELYPRLTAEQLIDWFTRARGGRKPPLREQLVERLDVVLGRPVRELSKGNRQKIGLVLAFMHSPQLLILDEPTSGLDPLVQNEFERLVRDTVAAGNTVFLSSHELDEVQRLADRVGIIRSGRLIAVDSVEGLRASAPQKLEITFPQAVAITLFDDLDGVALTAVEGARVWLEVTGPIGPVLARVAEQDPVDVICRHASLDELFLELYRDEQHPEASRAG
jgi:beta-exotoxin I transport system ATP-binding protein